MPSQPASRERVSPAPPIAVSPQEWDLLVRLPARVMIAATAAEPDSDERSVVEGLAGIDAIAAGTASESSLVRAVVSAIYAEREPDTPSTEEVLSRRAGGTEVLVNCRAASAVLRTRADPVDAEAYRRWLFDIAGRVCGAAGGDDAPGAGSAVTPGERRFLGELDRALSA